MIFANKDYYEGYFANDLFEGKGIYVWGGDRKYNGSWVNNQMQGEGTMVWNDGK